MQHHEIEPPPELADAIKGFWYLRIDFARLPAEGFEVLPDGDTEIIFYFGDTCSIELNGRLQPLPSPFMVGLMGQPMVLHSSGTVDIIGIKCFPWAVYGLLALPAGKGGLRTFTHPIAALQPRLAPTVAAGRVTDALEELKQYFLQAQYTLGSSPLLAKAGAALNQSGGALPVSGVAAAAHATVRTLERQFKQAAGHTVKDVSALMRFEQVRNRLLHRPDTPLAALAQELGYADQAHLSREFKRYSGATPAAFARKTKKYKSAGWLDFVAFIQA